MIKLLWLAALYAVTVFFNGIIVKWLLRCFKPENLPLGMPQAGKIIGYLERALILTLLLINQPTLIGFVLTIKAIYRYGDIEGDCHTKMRISEYFIIGTLASVLLTLLTYLFYRQLPPSLKIKSL